MALSDELWRESAAWLTKCQIIPPDHRINRSDSDIKLFARILRDGVLLCKLINFLDPTVEPVDFHLRPRDAQFLCLQNINTFLAKCKKHFNIRDADLFEPHMLYDLTNFHRVLNTLSKISQSKIVQSNHPNIPGFSSAQVYSSDVEEDIYKDLQNATTSPCSSSNAAFRNDEDEITKEEEVYQDLCALGTSERHRDQATISASLETRDHVINELLVTEQNFVVVLNALRYKFMQPMEKYLKGDTAIIFPRIKEILDLHTDLLERFREATKPHPKIKLSQIFIDFRERFLIYGDYCSKLTLATDTLREVSKNDNTISELIVRCQKDYSEGKCQLRDILSVPMQRILKYHLLLDNLVKETSHTHEDKRGLERAKEAMVDVAFYINEVKRDCEQLSVIHKVHDSIVDMNMMNGSDLSQYGRLLLDGDLYIKSHEDQKHKHRYAFVFEKIMIIVKNSNTRIGDGQYSYRSSINLAEYAVQPGHSRKTLSRDTRFKYQLLLARRSKEAAFTLYLKTEMDRDKWIKAFKDAMEVLEPEACKSTDHKFIVSTFDKPTTCRHCSKFLKGLLHQGYRCRTCDISVHKACISSSGRCRTSQPPPICDRYLAEFNWFVGTMDREIATQKLENRRTGTYLLRCRPQVSSDSKETFYALSLKTENSVKHMKIYQKNEDDQPNFYLSMRRFFKTIVDLVSFYERNDLGENFAGLNQSLQWPFIEKIAVALYDYTPREPNQLPLKKGCLIYIISREGDARGWLKGRSMDKIGFFPKSFVQENSPADNP